MLADNKLGGTVPNLEQVSAMRLMRFFGVRKASGDVSAGSVLGHFVSCCGTAMMGVIGG